MKKRLEIVIELLLVGLLITVVFSNYHIIHSTSDKIYSSLDQVPRNNTCLVLGTSRYLRGGGINPYFENRIIAAAELYEHRKVRNIIVSGDNSLTSYNEPRLMREALLEHGVPAESIYLDYAGFRTLDSVVRAKKIFGQGSITVVSQRFHAQRALFIAQHHGIVAVAYAAEEVSGSMGFKVMTRELFAKVKAVLDVYLFRTTPKFLGEAVEISSD